MAVILVQIRNLLQLLLNLVYGGLMSELQSAIPKILVPGRNLQLARYYASTAEGFLVLARCRRNTGFQTALYWHYSKR